MADPSVAELQEMAREVFGRELSEAQAEAYRGRLPTMVRIVQRVRAARAPAARCRTRRRSQRMPEDARRWLSDGDLAFASIAELAPRLAAREISPVELTDAMLAPDRAPTSRSSTPTSP